MDETKKDTINIVFKVLVVILLSLSYWHIMTLSNENAQIIDKLKYDLEFLKSKQSEIEEDLTVINEKLKYDLEFIKTTQATGRENHDILVELLNLDGRRKK